MLSQGVKRKLSELVAEPSFRLRQSGDSIFGEATGKRPRRLSLRGQLNPAGQFLQDDKGVVFPRQGIDFTRRTVFRGNSEFARTVSGAEIRLRTPSGELTARGKEYYTDPEITVEVPAFQNGLGRLGAFRCHARHPPAGLARPSWTNSMPGGREKTKWLRTVVFHLV